MQKRILLLFITSMYAMMVQGQNTLAETAEDVLFRNALNLYDKRQYTGAYRKFNRYIAQNPTPPRATEAQFYAAFCALELQNPDGITQLTELTQANPAHPQSRQAYYRLGNYYYNKGNYRQTIDYLEKANITNVVTDADLKASFQLGYAYFHLNRYAQAKPILNLVKGGNHAYAEMASYYAGHIAYQEGNNELALKDLEVAGRGRAFRTESNILRATIFYRQKKYDEVLFFVQELESQGEVIPEELSLLAGECYFDKKDYENAIRYMEPYVKLYPKQSGRGVNYRLGYSYFKTDQRQQAVKYLSIAADGADTLAQVSGYHLGISYISLGEKQLAIAAFDKCRRLTYEPRMQEKGGYYYVKVNFDLEYFSRVIEGAEYYEKTFPRGEHLQEIYSFSTEAYTQTGDYTKALQGIRQINPKSDKIKAAYQRIAYNKAVQHYGDLEFREAANMLKEALRYPMDEEFTNLSYYWLGEIYSFANRYDTALLFYQLVKKNTLQYDKALYGLGYSYYNTQQYEQAIPFFRSYIQESRDTNRDKKLDALVRLADCYYVGKNYENALNVYNAALQSESSLSSYIHYQKGVTYKAYGRLNDANISLDRVINDFPDSKHRDNALFEKAQIYFENGRREASIEWFSKLINEHPESNLLLYAYARRALAYTMIEQPANAVADYKKILDTNPKHKMAESAIQSLQEINAKGYAVNDLNTYLRIFKEANPASTATLAQEFELAKIPFNNGQYERAIISLKSFILKAEKTRYADDAYYMLGYCYEILGEKQKAIESYEFVQGDFKARAVRNLANLEFEIKNYSKAISYYLDLPNLTEQKRYLEASLDGLMRSYYEIEDYEAVQIYARRILDENIVKYKTGAQLYLGKVLYAQDRFAEAIVQLQRTTQTAQDENGAQAQYYIGLALRKQGLYEESTQALINVRKNYEGYLKWVYEAFLLIADNYTDLGNTFQAKATLNSIVENSKDPAVVAQAKERLKNL